MFAAGLSTQITPQRGAAAPDLGATLEHECAYHARQLVVPQLPTDISL